MAVAMAAFTANDAITKTVAAELNIGEIVVVRGCVAVALIGPLAVWRGALRPLRTALQPAVLLRVAGEVCGTLTFLLAITHLPLANASAIFSVLPLSITLAAALLFGEAVGWRRWLAIFAGFAGVLVIIRPGISGFNAYALLALTSVAFCTLRDLATRRISVDVPSLFVTLVTTVAVVAAGACLVVPLGGWQTPSPRAIGLLACAAVLLIVGYQAGIVALRVGDIATIAPFRYSALLWAMMFGYLAFGDVPDVAMLAGATIIAASGLYAFYRERIRARDLAQQAGLPPDGL